MFNRVGRWFNQVSSELCVSDIKADSKFKVPEIDIRFYISRVKVCIRGSKRVLDFVGEVQGSLYLLFFYRKLSLSYGLSALGRSARFSGGSTFSRRGSLTSGCCGRS